MSCDPGHRKQHRNRSPPSLVRTLASRLPGLAAALLLIACQSESDRSESSPGSASGARFPFPQNRPSAHCSYPSNFANADVRAAYAKWKTDLVTAEGAGGFRRVRRPDTPDGIANSTVSEGIAYGMLLAVYMDDQPLFDDLWQYAKLWADPLGLMSWYIDPEGKVACPGETGCGAATDADEDMAFALVMADRQWTNSPTLPMPYLEYAKQQIGLVWQWEVDHDLRSIPRPGDTWGGYTITNPSYFAPAYYRVFGQVTGNVEGWNKVIDASYTVVEKSLNATNGNADNGLVPAWCDGDGNPKPPDVGDATHYQYDSARMPFRMGQDFCWFGEPRAKAYLDKVSSFFAAQGAKNIYDGYALDGSPRPEAASEPSRSAVFVGSAGVGAMSSPSYAEFVAGTYTEVASLKLLVRSTYYNESWTALSLLMMSGNFLNLAGAS